MSTKKDAPDRFVVDLAPLVKFIRRYGNDGRTTATLTVKGWDGTNFMFQATIQSPIYSGPEWGEGPGEEHESSRESFMLATASALDPTVAIQLALKEEAGE